MVRDGASRLLTMRVENCPSPRAVKRLTRRPRATQEQEELRGGCAAVTRPRSVGVRRPALRCAADRAGAVERIPAAAIRHRRLPGALVRGLPGAEPAGRLRTHFAGGRGVEFLAGAAVASGADGVGAAPRAARARAWAAGDVAWRRSGAVRVHHAAVAFGDLADRHFFAGWACWRSTSSWCAPTSCGARSGSGSLR